jgi:hypothetical protein
MNSKPKKRVALVDEGPSLQIDGFLQFVADKYEFEFTDSYDADYVFHSCFGYDVLKYKGIRIFVTGENISPDMNISDYCMSFDQMTLGDRSCWQPLIIFYKEAYNSLKSERPPVEEIIKTKRDFCAYVMSSTRDSAPERTQIFELLNAYKTVHSGGNWNNNVGGRVPDKLKFQSSHKFVIAFENSSTPGYLTEKFADAAQVNAIPIYWGDPTIANYFNTKAFVNCHDFPSLEAAVKYVKEIDQNDELYQQMLQEPWFIDGIEPTCFQDETFTEFLSNIFDQDLEKSYRRNRSRWGLKYERVLLRMAHRPFEHLIRLLRNKCVQSFHRICPRKRKY